MVDIKELASFPLLKNLDENELTILAQRAQVKSFTAGSTIFEEGGPGGVFCLIKDGEIKITRLIREGESQTLGILSKGMYFGAISLIDGKTHSASVIAVTDGTIIQMERQDFAQLEDEDPKCALTLLRTITASLCESLRRMDAKFIDMVQYISKDNQV